MCTPGYLSELCAEEKWLTIPFLEQYEASCQGRIRNAKTQHIKAIDKSWNGYWRIQVWIPKEGSRMNRKYRVHRLVAAAWIGDDIEHDVDHIDSNKNNNAAYNLRYLEHSENVRAYYGNDLSESAQPPEPTVQTGSTG